MNPNTDTPFIEIVGLKRPATRANTPIEYLRLFLTDEIPNQIVIETNRYYAQQTAAKASSMKWYDITVEELLAFLGTILAMWLIKSPDIHSYLRRTV